jgi:hypothetical protein
MWGSYLASLRNVGCSTQVPVCALNNARKGTWGLPPLVKLERRDMTYTVSMWRKTQNKQNLYKVKGQNMFELPWIPIIEMYPQYSMTQLHDCILTFLIK